MLTSLKVSHYRGFKHLAVDGLSRVNLIAGKNNVGKTALLEAIRTQFVAHPNRIPLRRSRNYDRSGSAYVERWQWLFFDCDTLLPIEIESVDDVDLWKMQLSLQDVSGQVEIEEPLEEASSEEDLVDDEPGTGTGSLGSSQSMEDYFHTLKLVLYRSNLTVAAAEVRVVNREFGPRLQTIWAQPPMPRPPVRLEAASRLEWRRDWRILDFFVEHKREHLVLNALRRLDSRVKDLVAGGESSSPSLFVDVGLKRRVPITMLGEGFNRVASILLSMAACEGGLLLIDEIENGIHYSAMDQVWNAIGDAAREFNVQVFATTHSWECIRAAHHSFRKQADYDFRMVRIDRLNDHSVAQTYDRDLIDASLETGLEMR